MMSTSRVKEQACLLSITKCSRSLSSRFLSCDATDCTDITSPCGPVGNGAQDTDTNANTLVAAIAVSRETNAG